MILVQKSDIVFGNFQYENLYSCHHRWQIQVWFNKDNSNTRSDQNLQCVPCMWLKHTCCKTSSCTAKQIAAKINVYNGSSLNSILFTSSASSWDILFPLPFTQFKLHDYRTQTLKQYNYNTVFLSKLLESSLHLSKNFKIFSFHSVFTVRDKDSQLYKTIICSINFNWIISKVNYTTKLSWMNNNELFLKQTLIILIQKNSQLTDKGEFQANKTLII